MSTEVKKNSSEPPFGQVTFLPLPPAGPSGVATAPAGRARMQRPERHQVYQWICGGVSVNYHTRADFRVSHGDYLDQLLTGSVASLMHQGLVTLERVARERAERIDRALAEMPQVEATKKPEDQAKARVSTTDPETRVMTLVDGGFATKDDIERASGPDFETVVYTPVRKPRKEGQDPHAPRPGDRPAIIEWRRRMGTPQAKAIYKDRTAAAVRAEAAMATG